MWFNQIRPTSTGGGFESFFTVMEKNKENIQEVLKSEWIKVCETMITKQGSFIT